MGLVLYPYQWQYNGVAPFDEIAAWCKANLGGYGYIKYETIWFSKSEDYFLFMLRWS
jgi:hypothetical protein